MGGNTADIAGNHRVPVGAAESEKPVIKDDAPLAQVIINSDADANRGIFKAKPDVFDFSEFKQKTVLIQEEYKKKGHHTNAWLTCKIWIVRCIMVPAF